MNETQLLIQLNNRLKAQIEEAIDLLTSLTTALQSGNTPTMDNLELCGKAHQFIEENS